MSRRAGPPRLARALLDWLLPPSDAGAATGDLDEEYTTFVRPARGRVRAHLWYWRQVLLSAPRLLAARGVSRGALVRSVLGDVRFAARILRRRPGFAAAAILTLGLGLGANITVFTVVHAVLLRPLPFADADRLVRPLPETPFFINSTEAVLLGRRMTTFESFAAWGRTLFLFTDGAEAEEVRGARVAWNHFDMLGVDPLLGRTFVRADAEADDVIVLSHGLWVRRFGSDPNVIGRQIDLFGRRVTVIGVLRPDHVPVEFDWEAWRTLPLDPELSAGSGLAANALLRPGVEIGQAREELQRVLPEIWAEGGYVSPDEERASLDIVPIRRWLLGDVERSLFVLAGAVAFVLLLACANVANLLIAQGAARRREFSVRTALGGGRLRLARQLFIEVLLLSVLGGVVAVGAAIGALGWLTKMLPEELPRAAGISVSGPVLGFAVAITLGVAVLTGVLPALRGAGAGVGRLGRSGRGASAGRERARARSVLVASEMALAVVLVIAAGLMLRTVTRLNTVDPGFDAEGVVTFRPSPPADRYPSGAELDGYYDRLTAEVARLPGVEAVGAIQFLPMTPGGWWAGYVPEGRSVAPGENTPNTAVRVVRTGYFDAMRIPVVDGRTLTSTDDQAEAPRVAVVNESFAREAFPDGGAVGRRLDLEGALIEIVGVVGDVHQLDLRTTGHAEMYLPFGQVEWRRMHMVARLTGDVRGGVEEVAAVARALDPEVAMLGPRRLDDVVGSTFASARLVAALLTLFGLVGLGLGAIGVYGVTAQSVAERRREIGIRIALGAEASEVATATVLRGLVPVVLGVGVGIVGAVVTAGTLEGMLFGTAPSDLGTFLTAPSILLLVAVLSLAIPAMRASRVDPVKTLGED